MLPGALGAEPEREPGNLRGAGINVDAVEIVLDDQRRVQGLLTTRDLRFGDLSGTVASRMTPLNRLVVHTGDDGTAQAEETMRTHKVKKLPLLRAVTSVQSDGDAWLDDARARLLLHR